MKKTLFIAGAVLSPLVALAATNFGSVCDVAELVNKAKNVFAYIIYIFSALALIYAAFLFLTAGGSEDKIKTAKTAVLWGLVGIAVALFASYAIFFVRDAIVGGSFTETCSWGGGSSTSSTTTGSSSF